MTGSDDMSMDVNGAEVEAVGEAVAAEPLWFHLTITDPEVAAAIGAYPVGTSGRNTSTSA